MFEVMYRQEILIQISSFLKRQNLIYKIDSLSFLDKVPKPDLIVILVSSFHCF
jgi:hypothetical protein